MYYCALLMLFSINILNAALPEMALAAGILAPNYDDDDDIVESRFKTFKEWKTACETFALNTTITPLTKQELRAEVLAFIKAHKSGPLAHKENWIKTGSVQKPTDEFYKGTLFEPYVQKLTVEPDTEIAFHGDIHGDIDSLNNFIESLVQKEYLDKEDAFKVTKPNFKVIFLGDYTDRGLWGSEVLYTILRFVRTNPGKVFATRGNHEHIGLNRTSNFGYELINKFHDYSGEFLHQISKLYNYLPVALFLKCCKDALVCCHGGLEFGFDNAPALLDASQKNCFMLVDILKRKTKANSLPVDYKPSLNLLPELARITDFKPTEARMAYQWDQQMQIFRQVQIDPELDLGFMWTDFNTRSDENKEAPVLFDRSWVLPEQLTKYILERDSTPTCTLQGVFRAHQHCDPLMIRILNQDNQSDSDDAGVAKLWLKKDEKQKAGKLWNGIVCTFCVSPKNGYNQWFNYNYDAFGILKTAAQFDDWHLQMHRIETKPWQIRNSILPAPSCAKASDGKPTPPASTLEQIPQDTQQLPALEEKPLIL